MSEILTVIMALIPNKWCNIFFNLFLFLFVLQIFELFIKFIFSFKKMGKRM